MPIKLWAVFYWLLVGSGPIAISHKNGSPAPKPEGPTRLACVAVVQADSLLEATQVATQNGEIPSENIIQVQPCFPQQHVSFLFVKEPDGSYRKIA